MPSRKRNKGRARAAKNNQEGVKNKKCRHGFVPPPPGHVVHQVLHIIKDPNHKCLLESIHREYPEAIEDPNNRKMLKSALVSLGTYFLLNTPQKDVCEGTALCARYVLLLEEYEKNPLQQDERSQMRAILKHRDIADCDIGVLAKFFAKRIPCSCLDEKKEAAKTQPKRGRCFCCKEWKDHAQLLICGRCRVGVYCSSECQRVHWPDHKEICALMSTGQDIV